MEFNLVNLKITVRTASPPLLILRLTRLGGEFAAACKDVVCRRPSPSCQQCPERADCAWPVVFGQGLSADPAALRRYQKPPLPFVFSFPLLPGGAHPSGTLECGLVVVGRAIPCLDILLEGCAELLKQEAAEIVQVASLDYQGECRTVGNGARITRPENLAVLSAAGMVEGVPWDHSQLMITLLSPLKLLADGRQCTRFEFSRFAGSLMRRISSLAYYYGDRELDNDFRELSRQAADVVCVDDRYCYGTPKGMNRKLTGIIGSGRFSGDLSGLMPFLVLGTHLHVGKGASYGLGSYTLGPA